MNIRDASLTEVAKNPPAGNAAQALAAGTADAALADAGAPEADAPAAPAPPPRPMPPPGLAAADCPDHLLLDDRVDWDLHAAIDIGERWKEMPHAADRVRGFVLLATESLYSPPVVIGHDCWLDARLVKAIPEISVDGLELEFWLLRDGARIPLVVVPMQNHTDPSNLHELRVALPAGTSPAIIEVSCNAGPAHESAGDWAAIVSLVVAPSERIAELRSSAQSDWRLGNELQHFLGVYDNAFYKDRKEAAVSAADDFPLRAMPGMRVHDDVEEARTAAAIRKRLAAISPEPGEGVYKFSHRLLSELLPHSAPDFAARLKAIAAARGGRRPRLLSLCAGEAGIERGILRRAGIDVDICLVDVNEALLRKAAVQFPKSCSVSLVLGDVNLLSDDLGEFDAVVVVAGLHHVVKLEHVFGAINRMLAPTGELWVIGDQVGRNGNRLWPDSRRAADKVFLGLPESHRRNHNTGKTDTALVDADCSSACFEGIRSEDISALLDRFFLPVEVYTRNCFLWRLVNMAYAANYDLSRAADADLVRRLVAEEARHWSDGGRGTELHGVYKAKKVATEAARPKAR